MFDKRFVSIHIGRFLKTLLVLLVSIFGWIQSGQTQNLMQGLVGYYSFDGTPKDFSIHKNNGTVIGATLTTGRNNTPNSAYQFDGSKSYISLPINDLQNPSYTFSIWVKPIVLPKSNESQTIFSIGSVSDLGDQSISISNNYINQSSGYVTVGSYMLGTKPPFSSITTGTLPEKEKWVHLVVTRDNKTFNFYQNGKLAGTQTTYGSTPYYGMDEIRAIIGGHCTLTRFFNGIIDDLVIYNRVISDTEVRMLYAANANDLQRSVIKGHIYSDVNSNCQFDISDQLLSNVWVKTTPGDYYGITDSKGNYTIVTDTGKYQVSQLLQNINGKALQPTCPATNLSPLITLKNPGDSVTNINFGNKTTLLPYLSSSVNSTRRRRCFTNTTTVSYANSGYATASNVKVYLKLPQHVILKSADKPYVIDKDSNYVFTIGALAANQSGSIHIIDSVACVADIRGLTACTKVWVTPSNSYTLPADSDWDQSDIILSGKCIENGRIRLVIKNIGQAAMSDSSEFRILLDARLALRKKFKLATGDSLILRVPANGKTLRLEADQTPGHPRKAQTNLTIEGCVATSSEIVSKGFVDILPQDDAEPEVSISCLPIIDSYDPNDKQVSPIGTTTEHYTPTNADLKYTIRFQNTGSDTAYTVTVIDTLSDKLDLATLQMGAASHKYSFTVSGKGKPVLRWTFANINLPDSARNQLASNGFIQFSIKHKQNLTIKTRIENFADIVFDYNDPVRTNLTENVLYDVPPLIDNTVKLNEKTVLF